MSDETRPCRVDAVSGWCKEHDSKGRLQEILYCDKGPNPYRAELSRPAPEVEALSEEEKKTVRDVLSILEEREWVKDGEGAMRFDESFAAVVRRLATPSKEPR